MVRVNSKRQVSTLRWLQENTSVPVPRIFAYDDDPANAVGAAYIIEERVSEIYLFNSIFGLIPHSMFSRYWDDLCQKYGIVYASSRE
jgi:hypothetical protein